MFVVTLHFTPKRTQAAKFLQGHKDWLQQGFDDGVFVLVGSLQSRAEAPGSVSAADGQPATIGGLLLAHGTSRSELDSRVHRDPFVAHGIVIAEILEVAPSRLDSRLDFLGNTQPSAPSS